MVHTGLRLKINLCVALTAVFFIGLMWCFNTFIVLPEWTEAVEDLPLFLGIVGGLIAVALLIIYFLLKPVVQCLKKIEEKEKCDPETRVRAVKAMVSLPLVIILVNVVGFFLGPIGNMLPDALLGNENFFKAANLLTIFYNLLIGLVCSLTIIIECTLVLASAKRALNIHSREEAAGHRLHDVSLRLKNTLFPLGLAALFGALMGVAGFAYYDHEITSLRELYTKMAEEGRTAPAPPQAAGERATAEALLESLEGKENNFLAVLGVVFLILLSMTAGLALFFSGETAHYLKQYNVTLERILEGKGDLSQRLALIQFNELGDLGALFNRLIQTLQSLLKNVKDQAEAAAVSSGILDQFIVGFSHSIEEISSQASLVDANSRKQSEAVKGANRAISEILASVEEVKENVATQAAYIEESSAAIHEMSASTAQVSGTSREARIMSEALVELARNGEEKVGQTIQAIEGIEKTSRLVTEIVEVITRIASQTNLLAMHASIEAAHAGAFGKGFAVVADEVKKLAEESAQSAVQIGAEIEAMTHSIVNGVDLSRRTGDALGKITQDINQNTKLMTSIAQAMEEQDSGAEEILNSVGNIVQTTQQIKTRMADQFTRSNEIREKMDFLVASAADIRGAVDSQGINMAALKEAIVNLSKVMEKNREVVRELEKSLGQFKL